MASQNISQKPASPDEVAIDEALVGEFLATLSRELRGPLGPLRASLEMLKLSQPSSAALQIMERQVGDLALLVDSLTELSGRELVADPARVARSFASLLKPRSPEAKPLLPYAQRVGPKDAVPLNILVVDDSRDAGESMGMLLGHLGAEVRVAEDGTQALAAFMVCRPDIVFMDIGMPGMDGYELARHMREQPPAPEVTLVALTGWGQENDRKRILGSGFDHHLVKPAGLQSLQSLLDSIHAARRPVNSGLSIS